MSDTVINQEGLEQVNDKQLKAAIDTVNKVGFFNKSGEKINIKVRGLKNKKEIAVALVEAIDSINSIEVKGEQVELDDEQLGKKLTGTITDLYQILVNGSISQEEEEDEEENGEEENGEETAQEEETVEEEEAPRRTAPQPKGKKSEKKEEEKPAAAKGKDKPKGKAEEKKEEKKQDKKPEKQKEEKAEEPEKAEEEKAEKKKAPLGAKYTRFDSVRDAMKAGSKDPKEIAEKADGFYKKHPDGGSSNIKESKWATQIALKVLESFSYATKTEEGYTIE